MNKTKSMKAVFIFVILSLKGFVTFSQNVSNETQSSIPSIEKIYLHTDRSYYNVGESLWYKAYSVYAYTNILFDNSDVLYVELISPESKLIARNITKLENGMGHGDFKLADSLKITEGTYLLRAYTNWTRNFGDDFIFKKEINVVDISKNTSETIRKINALTNSKEKTKDNITDKSNFIDVQFFPEGGSLIEEVLSFVAFKATDNKGNPIPIKGSVFDSNKKLISLFKSTHDGMGKFMLLPSKGQEYIAEIIKDNGETIEFKVPKAKTQGYVLSSKVVKEKKVITIKTNQSTLDSNPNSPLTFVCSAKSVSYFEGTQPLEKKSLSFLFPATDLPEGIIQMTLFDEHSIPHSERLIYNEKEHHIDVSINLNKNQYAPKEKVNLRVEAKTKEGVPILASFSMASIDENGAENEIDNSMNICSYFLLDSDIKGKVYNPGYYFNQSNPNRLNDLDLLLLTQGWRDFLWKKLPDVKGDFNYKVEKGINISGSVRKLFGNSPKENSSVNMILMNKGESAILTDITGANGEFEFNNLQFNGSTIMMLNSQNEKGKNRGTFLLDSMLNKPSEIVYKRRGYLPSKNVKTIKETIYNKHINFNVPIDNRLDEIVIVGKKKKDERSTYGISDRTFYTDEKTPNFSDIFQLIQYSIPGIIATGKSISYSKYNGPALIVIDEVVAEMEDLQFVHPDDVSKIESIDSGRAAVFGSKGANGVVLVYIKEGSSAYKKDKKFHSITKIIHGFQDTRVFYAPNYDESPTDFNKEEDVRNTLYWNPYIHPDENGVSEVSYYNSNVSTKVKVTLEGITEKGIPIVTKAYYKIEKE